MMERVTVFRIGTSGHHKSASAKMGIPSMPPKETVYQEVAGTMAVRAMLNEKDVVWSSMIGGLFSENRPDCTQRKHAGV